MYRLMQISETTIPVAAKFTHLFSHRRKRNRLEFMADFPRGDEAEVISSLQVCAAISVCVYYFFNR